jgi:dephospho-CoA kinase
VLRLMKRSNLSAEDAVKRIHSQMDIREKILKADIIIENGGT